jgi:hypothetical protein
VHGKSDFRQKPHSDIIKHVLSVLGIPKTEPFLLATEDWGRTLHLVFDLHHTSYDFDTAHIAHEIHVVMVLLGGKKEKEWVALPREAEQVNNRIAQLHNFNGWDKRPPFNAKHTSSEAPTYDNPRDVQVSTS